MWVSKRQKNGGFTKKLFIWCITIFVLMVSLFSAYYYIWFSKKIISPLPMTANKYNSSKEELKILLKKNKIPFSSVLVSSDSSSLVVNVKGQEVLFSTKKNLNSQVSSLQLILSRLTIEGKQFKRLDLRFDKPVIMLIKL